MLETEVIIHQGRSLYLRRTLPQDASFLYQTMYQNDNFMKLFRLNDYIENEIQLRKRLIKQLKSSSSKKGYLELLILHRKYGPIGISILANYSLIHRRSEFLIGFFNETYYYKGYGIEASLLMGDLAFNHFDLHRVYSYSYDYNYNAQRCLTAGGFMKEGIMKGHLFDKKRQKFIDLHIYGLIVEQFRCNRRLAKLSKRLIGYDVTQSLYVKAKVKFYEDEKLPTKKQYGMQFFKRVLRKIFLINCYDD